MIHGGGAGARARSRKINYISKVEIEFAWRGAFVFARRRPSAPRPLYSAPYSRETAEILNESLLMKATSRALLPAGKRRRRWNRRHEVEVAVLLMVVVVVSRGEIVRRFSAAVFRASSSTHGRDFSRSFVSSFFLLASRQIRGRTTAAKNERYRGPGKNVHPTTCRDRNCFRKKLGEMFGLSPSLLLSLARAFRFKTTAPRREKRNSIASSFSSSTFSAVDAVIPTAKYTPIGRESRTFANLINKGKIALAVVRE